MKDRRTVDASGQELHRAVREAGRALARLLKAALESESQGETPVRLDHPFSNLSREEWSDAIRIWNAAASKLLADVPTRSCPACGADDSAPIFESYDSHLYAECRRCRCWYAPKRIDSSLFEQLFSIAPQARRFGDYTTAQATRPEAAAADRTRFEIYYRDLKDLYPGRNLSTLDIGCGVGSSLIVAQELGFLAAGVEVNKTAVDIARSRGLPVDFPSNAGDGKRYDVVTFWESLEHLHDPLAALKAASAQLAPDGVVAITVPNLNSPSIRGLRGDSLQIHGGPAWPGHINLFTSDTVARLLARADFEVFDIAGQYSMNLPEIIAYNAGAWSGARDYLRQTDPVVTLPALAALIAAEWSPVAAAWEEGFAFAPILRIIAGRRGAAPPPGLRTQRASRRARIVAGLNAHYGGLGRREGASARGREAGFDASFFADGATAREKGLRFTGAPAPYAYLWKSRMIMLAEGEALRMRGRLYSGGVTFGLLRDGNWSGSINHDAAGVFELEVAAPSSCAIEAVVANCNPAATVTDVDFDYLEIIAGND